MYAFQCFTTAQSCIMRTPIFNLTFLQHQVGAWAPQETNVCLQAGRLPKRTPYIKLKCWAPQISWLGTFGLPVIFLREGMFLIGGGGGGVGRGFGGEGHY